MFLTHREGCIEKHEEHSTCATRAHEHEATSSAHSVDSFILFWQTGSCHSILRKKCFSKSRHSYPTVNIAGPRTQYLTFSSHFHAKIFPVWCCKCNSESVVRSFSVHDFFIVTCLIRIKTLIVALQKPITSNPDENVSFALHTIFDISIKNSILERNTYIFTSFFHNK